MTRGGCRSRSETNKHTHLLEIEASVLQRGARVLKGLLQLLVLQDSAAGEGMFVLASSGLLAAPGVLVRAHIHTLLRLQQWKEHMAHHTSHASVSDRLLDLEM